MVGVLTSLAVLAGGCFAIWWFSFPAVLEDLEAGPISREWATWRRQRERWEQDGVRRQLAHRWVELDQISPLAAHAVLVSEDINFFGHRGVDPGAVREALREWRRGRRLRGASTVTQQLAKSLFLSPERSFRRKIREAKIAWWMERRLGKQRILELYLNVVEFGPGVYGVEAAAQHYFSAAASDLDEYRAAGLAAAIPSPGRDNPSTATARWMHRQSLIMRRMERSPRLAQILTELCGQSGSPTDPSAESSYISTLVNIGLCL